MSAASDTNSNTVILITADYLLLVGLIYFIYLVVVVHRSSKLTARTEIVLQSAIRLCCSRQLCARNFRIN